MPATAAEAFGNRIVSSPSAQRRLVLFAAGATSALPLMKSTATGFSVVCVMAVALMAHRLGRRGFQVPLLFALAGSLAYVISSVVNETSLLAINVPAFPAVALYMCGLVALTDGLAEIAAVLAGASMGTIFFYVLIGTTLTQNGQFADLWKYGLAPSVTVIVLWAMASSRLAKPIYGAVVLAAMSAISIELNFRSHALICAAAALIVAIDAVRRRPLPMVGKVLVGIGVGVGASLALTVAAKAGFLSAALTTKIELQAAQHVPALLAGRTEPPLSVTAIAHNPIVGWGSANNIPAAVFDDAYQLAFRLGFDSSFPFRSLWRMPDGSVSLHSVLLGSWAEAGVVGVLFPLWLLWAVLTLIRFAPRHPAWSALLCFLGVQGLWDLFFSPWSYNLPIVYAAISVICVLLRSEKVSSPSDDTAAEVIGDDARYQVALDDGKSEL